MELVIDGTKLSKLYSSFNWKFFQFMIVKCDGNIEQFIVKTTS